MCFFSVIDYACGDWKWGNMREQCPREHRMGEQCGARLLHHETSVRVDWPCSTCKALDTKHRRLDQAREKLRWRRDNGLKEFQYSIAKAEQEIRELREDIVELEAKRSSAKLASSRKGYPSKNAIVLPRMESTVSVASHRHPQHTCKSRKGGW